MTLLGGAVYRRVYAGLNARLPFIFGGKFAHHCRPNAIMFLLTERCNARCLHCDIWRNQGKEDSPSTEQWMRVLDDLRSWLGPVAVVFTGGEALLKPNTIELAEHASRLGLSLELLTHGYWSDQSKIERLALSGPAVITISLDGLGATHSKIRGRDDFFERTNRTIETLVRVRAEHRREYRIRLKTVVMEHNLEDLAAVARYATRDGMEVFYQPIEQNYNTTPDPDWRGKSPNWPRNPDKAVQKVEELAQLKREGLHIANTDGHFDAMIRYFREPDALRMVTQAHMAHLKRQFCAAFTMLQLQSNGDAVVCSFRPAVGNIKESPIRQIWERRTRYWETGCCLGAAAAS